MSTLVERFATLSKPHKQLLAKKLLALPAAGETPGRDSNYAESTTTGRSEDGPIRLQLVAYFTRSGTSEHDVDAINAEQGDFRSDYTGALRTYLQQKLPAHQQPATLIELEHLPRLPNGKIAVNELPAFSVKSAYPSFGSERRQPRDISTAEEFRFGELAGILGSLLGMDDIRPEDNFFELGGDSITAIQFVSKARDAGFNIDIRLLTTADDLGEIAQIGMQAATPTSRENATGPTPLTPIQRWFFAQQHIKPEHWNVAGRVIIEITVDTDKLHQAISASLKAHPALGTRFSYVDNEWSAVVPDEDPPEDIILIQTLKQSPSEDQLNKQLNKLQSGFVLDQGWLLRFLVQIETTRDRTTLALVAHHLVIDALSVDLLITDIESRYNNLKHRTLTKAMRATSLSARAWAIALADIATDHINADVVPQQLDSLDVFDPTITSIEADVVDVVFSLDVDWTTELLAANETFNTTTNELLVTAISTAWLSLSGNDSLIIDIESHGRDIFTDNQDCSGTIGWLTSFYPVMIKMSSADILNERIKRVKESMRTVSNDAKLSLLKRYSPTKSTSEVDPRILVSPPILFNYMGKVITENHSAYKSAWRNQPITENFLRYPANRRSHPVEINTVLELGCLRWTVRLSEPPLSKHQIDIFCTALKDELRRLTTVSKLPEASAITPSDFPGLQMDQDELDSFLSTLE